MFWWKYRLFVEKRHNVNSERFTTEGYGEAQPVATNDTEAGRAQNRRVEVAIWANEKLKDAAEKQAG
jgi:outer membrane protein OmpA-like peptidoglycan-associated protein